jgi:hypothetical protein
LFAEIAEPDRYVNSLQFFLTVVCGKRTIFAMKTLGENAKKIPALSAIYRECGGAGAHEGGLI